VHSLHAFGLPLAQECSVAIHHRDAAVATFAFAIGNVNVTILGINKNAGGQEEPSGVGILRFPLEGAVSRVKDALFADR
jgi:hypothetical protein